ncbi:MAG: UDP-N-acetylmuramate--L-alanine ligase [Lachnospiraceae bacterium]|jgi:UDP-N-acetylmuramate--alanine ligase|nr:UDP-N-acetylmuramate--L-alanine ligase [Lachnospiraceae bacterium]
MEINGNKPLHVYFIGIGGISMSALAEILLTRGYTISGSDVRESDLTQALTAKGAHIHIGQRRENLTVPHGLPDIDLVVYTAAISTDNPEWIAMNERGLPSLSRAELLGQLMKTYHTPIAVSGTHGKTTTTGMIAEILIHTDHDPTITIGGILLSLNANLRIGKSGYFITEACEYANSYLNLFPKIGLILNVEADHLDFFSSLDEVRQSFRRFARLLPADGLLVISGDVENLEEITADLACHVVTFGFACEHDYYITDTDRLSELLSSFSLRRKGRERTDRYQLATPGKHNILNAVAAIAVADFLGINENEAAKSLAAFPGVERRFEKKGNINGFTIIDDYAHHPTEVETTLRTAARLPHRELWCVFQPHTYTRTQAFLAEFAAALSLADKVVVVDIYAAREKNESGISSRDLVKAVKEKGGECYYIPTGDPMATSFSAVEKFLLENLLPNDLLITMGAGDVGVIGENLLLQK